MRRVKKITGTDAFNRPFTYYKILNEYDTELQTGVEELDRTPGGKEPISNGLHNRISGEEDRTASPAML